MSKAAKKPDITRCTNCGGAKWSMTRNVVLSDGTWGQAVFICCTSCRRVDGYEWSPAEHDAHVSLMTDAEGGEG